MAKRRETQIQVLETARGELEMSISAFADALGVSRQWYHDRLNKGGDVLGLRTLAELSVGHADGWIGKVAVDCIRLMDARFVPCPCQTEIGDRGPCPRHGEKAEVVA